MEHVSTINVPSQTALNNIAETADACRDELVALLGHPDHYRGLVAISLSSVDPEMWHALSGTIYHSGGVIWKVVATFQQTTISVFCSHDKVCPDHEVAK